MSFGDFGDGPAACRSCSSNFADPLTRSSGKLPPLKSVRSSSKKCEPRPVLSPRNQSADKFSPTIHIDMDTSINHPKQSFFKNHHQSLRWTCFSQRTIRTMHTLWSSTPWLKNFTSELDHCREKNTISGKSHHFPINFSAFFHTCPIIFPSFSHEKLGIVWFFQKNDGKCPK